MSESQMRDGAGSRSLEDLLAAAPLETPMPSDVRARVRDDVMRSLDPAPLRSVRLTFARAAAVFACCGTLLTGASYAAAHSLPGDALYPLKRAAQEMRVAFTPHAGQGDALIRLSDTRAEEVRLLMQQQAEESRVQRAVDGFGDAVDRAVQSAPDTPTAQQRVRRIEDAVSDEPAPVRERVKTGLPSTGSGAGSGTGSGAGSGTGSGTGSGAGAGSGSGSGSGTGSGTGTGPGAGAGSGSTGEGSNQDGSGQPVQQPPPVSPGRP